MSHLTPSQQEDVQTLQKMSQTLSQLHNQAYQFEGKKREVERTIETLKDLPADREVFQSVGQIFFKNDVGTVVKKLEEDLEILEIRVTKAKKQAEDYEAQVRNLESKIKASLGQ